MRKCNYLLLLCFFILGCENDTPIDEGTSNSILFFFDKTVSINQGEEIAKKNKEVLRDILSNASVEEGDKVAFYFVHENTQGARPFMAKEYDDIVTENLGGGGFSKKLGQAMLEEERTLRRNDLKENLERAFMAENDQTTNRQTDLWATLEVMSDFYRKSSPDTWKQVCILSDMREDMMGSGRRNFTKLSPKSRKEAEAWAEADAKVMREKYKLSDSALQDISIKVLTPYGVFEENNFAEIRYYWQALFAEFGITDVDM